MVCCTFDSGSGDFYNYDTGATYTDITYDANTDPGNPDRVCAFKDECEVNKLTFYIIVTIIALFALCVASVYVYTKIINKRREKQWDEAVEQDMLISASVLVPEVEIDEQDLKM